MKLIRIKKSSENWTLVERGLEIQFVQYEAINHDGSNAEFYLVEETLADRTMQVLAKQNPGKEIQCYRLEATGVCPAGDFVAKTVSKDGVLPK